MPQAIPNDHISELISNLAKADVVKTTKPANAIHISELTSLPAFAYEKLRNIVDYKDEDLLRKNAIRRFLKRNFFIPQLTLQPAVLARELVRELILSRYLPNDSVAEDKLADLGELIHKYYLLFNEVKQRGCDVPRWREQILGLAAVESDIFISPPLEKNAYTAYATQLLKQTLNTSALLASDEEQNIQLVLSIERVLNRADRDVINYYLLRHYEPIWFTAQKLEAVNYLAPLLPERLKQFALIGNHRVGRRLLPIVRRLLVPLVILRSCWQTETKREDLVRNPSKLTAAMRQAYQKYWQATRRRIRLKGFHAMAYIFITKILLAILIELPYEKLILGHVNYLALSINLLFPPLLMLIITLLIKSPKPENEQQIINAIQEMVYAQTPEFFKTQQLWPRRPRILARFFYGILYLITITASFGAVGYVLWRLNFNFLSGAMFIFFVSLVSFFGINLRQQARQLTVIRGRETISSFLIDFFSFPIVALGKWLSTTFDRYNFFVFILDFLFEIPFKILLKIIENWFHFLKEKKEEMM